MTAINKCVRELLDMQLSGYSDEAVKEKQTELNSIYSSFTKKYGLLNSQVNKSAFKEDVSLPLLIALEKVKDGKLVQKADIFTKRTIRPQISITHVVQRPRLSQFPYRKKPASILALWLRLWAVLKRLNR